MEAGLRLEDLDRLSYGMVTGILHEKINDSFQYPKLGSPKDVGGIVNVYGNEDQRNNN